MIEGMERKKNCYMCNKPKEVVTLKFEKGRGIYVCRKNCSVLRKVRKKVKLKKGMVA